MKGNLQTCLPNPFTGIWADLSIPSVKTANIEINPSCIQGIESKGSMGFRNPRCIIVIVANYSSAHQFSTNRVGGPLHEIDDGPGLLDSVSINQ